MKTTLARLLTLLFLAIGISTTAQNRVSIEAYNDDISYYLDLKAIASVFAECRDLEEFEYRLNDYQTGLSNLDLNNDGYIDYLRVIETSENNVHLIVIQAVLNRDVYQDVASIVIERDRRRHSTVQIIGHPYLYGHNYVIEPVFYRTPKIYRWFWAPRYRSWSSPYYWGYYPTYYHYRNPLEVRVYVTHVHSYVNVRNEYRYADNRRNAYANRMYSQVSRNDYGTRYPDRSFNQRNANYKNKQEYSRSSRVNANNKSRSDVNSGRNSNNSTYRRSAGDNTTNSRSQSTTTRVGESSRRDANIRNGQVRDTNSSSVRTNNSRSTGYTTEGQRNSGATETKATTNSRANTQNSRTNQSSVQSGGSSSSRGTVSGSSRNANTQTNSRSTNTQSSRENSSQNSRVDTRQSNSSSSSSSGVKSNPRSSSTSSSGSSSSRESGTRSSKSTESRR